MKTIQVISLSCKQEHGKADVVASNANLLVGLEDVAAEGAVGHFSADVAEYLHVL